MLLPVPKDKIKAISKRLETIFREKDLNVLGRRSGFIRRQRVVSGVGFAHLCIQGAEECGLNASLTQLLAQAGKLGMALSAEGLNERFTASAEAFMQQLLAKVSSWQIERALKLNTLAAFSEVLVEDSSTWQLPACLQTRFKGCGGGASPAGIKLNVRLDVKGTAMQVCFRPGTASDHTAGLGLIPRRSLLLRDLGYFKIDDFRAIKKRKAFYISRFKYDTKVYTSKDPDEPPLDLLTLSKHMQVNEIRQLWAYIGKTERFRTRLILQKVPPEVAQTKRKKLQEDKQNKRKMLSSARLEFCTLSAFITNLPEKAYAAPRVMTLYSIRWMIEIIFKVWKSVYRIDELRPMNEHRFMCLLYGKLIWITLHHNLFGWIKRYFWNTYHMEVSELKGFKILQELKTDFQKAIWTNAYQACSEFLTLFYQLIAKIGRKQVRRRKFNQLLFYDHHIPPQATLTQSSIPYPALS